MMCVYVCVCVCVCVNVYGVCVSVRVCGMCVAVHACVYVWYACLDTCVLVYMCACVCVHGCGHNSGRRGFSTKGAHQHPAKTCKDHGI